jgi:hypothetical protein
MLEPLHSLLHQDRIATIKSDSEWSKFEPRRWWTLESLLLVQPSLHDFVEVYCECHG